MSVWVPYHLKYPGELVEGAGARFHVVLRCTDEEATLLEAILERNGAKFERSTKGSPLPPWTVEAS